jgi:error-prone DNA polymerase
MRAGIPASALEKLANADAFQSLDMTRREVLWDIKALGANPLPLFVAASERDYGAEAPVTLPPMTLGEEVIEDYASLRLSLRAHPMKLLRPAVPKIIRNAELGAAALAW